MMSKLFHTAQLQTRPAFITEIKMMSCSTDARPTAPHAVLLTARPSRNFAAFLLVPCPSMDMVGWRAQAGKSFIALVLCFIGKRTAGLQEECSMAPLHYHATAKWCSIHGVFQLLDLACLASFRGRILFSPRFELWVL